MCYRDQIIRSLDFVVPTENGLDYWKDVVVTDWAQGNAIGRERPAQAIRFMRETGDPTLTNRICRSFLIKPVDLSLIVGFDTELSMRLIRG